MQGCLIFCIFKKIQQFFSFFTKSREQLKSKVQRMLQFWEFKKVFQLLHKIERAVEIKGAGGASVFAISKIFKSFSAFLQNPKSSSNQRCRGCFSFLQFPKDLTVFQLFYKIERAVENKGADGASVFKFQKRFSVLFYKI